MPYCKTGTALRLLPYLLLLETAARHRIKASLVYVWKHSVGEYMNGQRLQTNPAYPIDFGAEKHGLEGRWDHFQVKDLCGTDRNTLVLKDVIRCYRMCFHAEDPRLPEHEEGLPLLPQLRDPCQHGNKGVPQSFHVCSQGKRVWQRRKGQTPSPS